MNLEPVGDLPLTAENQTEQETNPKRGKDRLRRVLANVLLAVVLETADTMDRVTLDLLPAGEIFIGCLACGRAEIFRRFVNVRPSTLCVFFGLRRNRRPLIH
jgi:hypothetical protein